MLRFFRSLARAVRRAPGPDRVDAMEANQDDAALSGESLIRRKRVRIAVIAILVGVGSAVIDLPLPLEDGFRAVRSQLRTRPAPQDILVVTIDDASLNELGAQPTRFHEAVVVERLLDAGVSRIVFDRAHADLESPAADARFLETLKAWPGKIWLGSAPESDSGFQGNAEILPNPLFRRHASIASMAGKGTPFALSLVLPTWVEVGGGYNPSISAVLAGYEGVPRWYRPDFSIDPNTVASLSYSDAYFGRFRPDEVRGKAVVVGETYFESSDVLYWPGKGRVAGVIFHVIGAHTLKRGLPTDLAWFPAMLLVAVVVVIAAQRERRLSRSLWITSGVLIVAPIALDELRVSIDVMPGMLGLLMAGMGFRHLARKYYSSEFDAMKTSALELDKAHAERDVYALKITHLADLSEDWSSGELGEFVSSLISYVKGPGEARDVAFDKDVLVWLAPRMSPAALETHADGLAMMLKAAIRHDWQSSGPAPSLGIDTNHALPLGQRIKKAMNAAEEAGSRGQRFVINDAAHVEARNQRLGLIRVLEKGLQERNIGVGYQPKIDLASGRIVGAETLIRWQPPGEDKVDPQELVLAAEATDRINELTLIVMETAFQDAKRALSLDPKFRLAVNMSAKGLSDTGFLFEMMTLLGKHHFPAHNLTLELTETAKLEDARIAPQIEALKQRGIGLSIDDFGTGQSNLEYLEKLPSSELKIDKRFVQHMESSEESRAVVRATIEIAHSLGKTVVAEGVETLAIAAELRAMGCDQGQGYLFSRAVTIEQLLALMQESAAA